MYSPAREKAFTAKNIKAGFAASGLFPFNPDRVLKSVPQPVPTLLVSVASTVIVGPSLQENILQTPATPVSAEGLMSLQNRIIKHNAYALKEKSKQSLQRHLYKLTKAAQLSFAQGALQQNQIQFLLKVNNEAKVRRSTKSLVLGTAKIMGYEDLQHARAKRPEIEAAKKTKAKEKRGRKRTNAALEVDAIGRKAKVARIGTAPDLTVSAVAHVSKATIAESESGSGPWRALVARMY